MRVEYHPLFAEDIKGFETQYSQISSQLALRFRAEIDKAIDKFKDSPLSAGHFVNTGQMVVAQIRRRNLRHFPFFILYGVADGVLYFGQIKASASNPLHWLHRFPEI
jgi:hypothetical protein